MKNKRFIISYDNCDEIINLYKKYNMQYVLLNYSLENKKKTKEPKTIILQMHGKMLLMELFMQLLHKVI